MQLNHQIIVRITPFISMQLLYPPRRMGGWALDYYACMLGCCAGHYHSKIVYTFPSMYPDV